MTRSIARFLAVPFAASAMSVPVLAHPGHVAEQAGHTHWLALAAAGLAVAIVALGVARALIRRRRRLAHG